MKLRIEIDMKNDAFVQDLGYELDVILDTVAYRVSVGRRQGSCMDSNGNTVGHFIVTDGGE